MVARNLTPKSNVELQKQQYKEWTRLLTIDPIQRGAMLGEFSALGVSLFIFSFFFCLSVVVLQPFWGVVRPSYYENLSAVAFTFLALVLCGVGYLFLDWFFHRRRRRFHWIRVALRVIIISIVTIVPALFFYLFFREIVRWVLAPDGLALFWEGIFQFLQSIF